VDLLSPDCQPGLGLEVVLRGTWETMSRLELG
jgi:hypothetical protein